MPFCPRVVTHIWKALVTPVNWICLVWGEAVTVDEARIVLICRSTRREQYKLCKTALNVMKQSNYIHSITSLRTIMCVLSSKGIESQAIIDHGTVLERSANANDCFYSINDAPQLINGGPSFNYGECRDAK